MALQDAILAALTFDESSGYDLAKRFNVTVANYWTASPQQLYRELDKLESAGLVEARVVEQEKRPNKRVFSLTGAGREALHEFTTRPPKPSAIRDELLVQVEVMELGDVASVRAHVQDQLAASESKLKRYQKRRDLLLDGRTEGEFLTDAARLGPYFTLTRGISFEQENIRWCRFVLETLSAREPQ